MSISLWIFNEILLLFSGFFTINLINCQRSAGCKYGNKTQFLALIKDKQGDYKTKEGSDAVCQNASFSLIKDPTQGFSLGTLIDFSDLHNGTGKEGT